MDKDEWYRDRILWKADQHRLFDKKCYKYSDLPDDHVLVIKEAISSDINPVIVFWESRKKWTVLGTKAICSFYDDNLIFSELDRINKQLSILHPIDVEPSNVKLESTFIKLDAVGKLIWVPAGSELFALMNILKMFPLSEKNIA